MSPRKITTLDELNTLPLWSVVLTDADTARPDVWQRLKSGRERTLRDWTMVNDDRAQFCAIGIDMPDGRLAAAAASRQVMLEYAAAALSCPGFTYTGGES